VIGRKTFLLLSLLLASTADAQQQDQERLRRMAELVNRPVVYSVSGMDKVQVRKDLVYKKTDDPNMRMDVYLPAGLAAGEKRPAVIFLHGGAPTQYKPKDWGIYGSWGRLVAASGMVAVTFTYRLGFPKTIILDGASDVADALSYVHAHAGELGIDDQRLCLAAYSAGGPMLSPYLHGAPESIRCVVGFYPFMDIRQSEAHRNSETAETLQKFSPIVQISTGSGRPTPVFLAQGGKDEIPTLRDSVDRFVAEALVHGVPITFMSHPDAPHGFDNQTDDDRTREIVRNALDFLKWHLR
jgi:acetyl esterase/lipase